MCVCVYYVYRGICIYLCACLFVPVSVRLCCSGRVSVCVEYLGSVGGSWSRLLEVQCRKGGAGILSSTSRPVFVCVSSCVCDYVFAHGR